MFRVMSLGDARRYFRIRGRVTLIAARLSLYERRNVRFLRDILRKGDTAVDVGANFGAYTQAMSVIVGKTGSIWAFEPIPLVFDVMSRNLSRRGNVNYQCIALSDHAVTGVTLNLPLLWGGLPEPALASVEPVSVAHETLTIDLTALDDYLERITSCVFIKVDVEGHEHSFLRGAERLIDRDRPIVQLESNDLERDVPAYLAYAKARNYDLRYLDRQGALVPLHGSAADGQYNLYLVPDGWVSRSR